MNIAMYQKGNIFLFNNKSKSSIYSRLQRFFTGYEYSHTSVGLGHHFGDLYTLSSDMLCYVQPLNKYLGSGDIDMEVYRFQLYDDKMIDIVNKFVKEYSGMIYAYTQILWFIFRWVSEKFFNKDVRKHHNWFALNTVVCSELTFLFIQEIASVYNLADVLIFLGQWHSSNVHVGDIKVILEKFPQYFEKI